MAATLRWKGPTGVARTRSGLRDDAHRLRGAQGGAPGELHLKKCSLATTCGRVARIFSKLRCNHPKDYKYAPIADSKTRRTGFYTRLMRKYVVHAMYLDIIVKHVPAMLVIQIHDEPQPHRE